MKLHSTTSALFLLAAVSAVNAQEQAASSASSPAAKSVIGYATVEEALQSLKAKPGANITVTKPDSWVIVTEPGTYAQWSFTPAGHYAYPAVVRREIKQNAGAVAVEMSALCQADKAACDKLIAEFTQLNERMRQSVQSSLKGNAER